MNRKQFQEERQDEVDNGIYKSRSTSVKPNKILKRETKLFVHPSICLLFNSDMMFDVAEILNCVNTREELYPNAYILSFGEVYIDNPIQTICEQTSPPRVLLTDITGILDKHASSHEILSHGLNHEQDGRPPTNRAPPFSALLKPDLHSTKDELRLR
ncbi:hypothetical protein V1478_009417 [Vespula squamosa]|uniref:Uncharacterized protein n=1 Tax=Vespula squamosa TaxID=30214 RepID=A0ABD2APL3_VESSQ